MRGWTRGSRRRTRNLQCRTHGWRSWTRGSEGSTRGSGGRTRGSGSATREAESVTHGSESVTRGSTSATHGSRSADCGSGTATQGSRSTTQGSRSADRGSGTATRGSGSRSAGAPGPRDRPARSVHSCRPRGAPAERGTRGRNLREQAGRELPGLPRNLLIHVCLRPEPRNAILYPGHERRRRDHSSLNPSRHPHLHQPADQRGAVMAPLPADATCPQE